MEFPIVSDPLVFYYIPGDHDDPAHPNCFVLPKLTPDHPPTSSACSGKRYSRYTLKDIKDNFPLPGSYYFRFRIPMEGSNAVWVDLSDDDAPVPLYRDRIFTKVLRLTWENTGSTRPATHKLSQGLVTDMLSLDQTPPPPPPPPPLPTKTTQSSSFLTGDQGMSASSPNIVPDKKKDSQSALDDLFA